MPLSVVEIGRRLGAQCEHGAGTQCTALEALATPAAAGPADLSFIAPGAGGAQVSRAAAVLARNPRARTNGRACVLVVDDVFVACARASAWLPVRRNQGNARVSASAIAPSARIAARAVVAPGARIGDETVIEDLAVIGPDVTIGAYSRIGAGAVVNGCTDIGNRVIVGGCSVIGEDGFAFVRDGTNWLRMPSFGGVAIGDDVVILGGSVVHAGVFGDTRIASGCALDSLVLIGHDSSIGTGTAIAAQTALAGAAVIGAGCLIGAKVGIGEGVRVADRVTITAMSMVTRSIDAPAAATPQVGRQNRACPGGAESAGCAAWRTRAPPATLR